MSNSSSGNIINPDDYLNLFKPRPIEYHTRQEIFDGVIRVIFRQKTPCVRIDDITREISKVRFNSSGYVSPLLVFCTKDDLRYLKKIIGYEILQTLDTDNLLTVNRYVQMAVSGPADINIDISGLLKDEYNNLSENVKEISLKLIEVLSNRRIDSKGVNLLCILEARVNLWFRELDINKFASQMLYLDLPDSMKKLNYIMSRFAYAEALDESVLKFSP